MIAEEKKERLKEFGQNLRKIREDKGHTLRSLSHECNIDWSDISKIEKGKTNIRIATLMELADALKIPASELLSFHTPRPE